MTNELVKIFNVMTLPQIFVLGLVDCSLKNFPDESFNYLRTEVKCKILMYLKYIG